MVEIELDGKKVDIAPGSMVMHAAEKAGVYIPHFCYHKKLSIAANCRMCLVDVEKAPKPMPACATPVTQGMVVRTKSDKAIKAQKSVMEFLLINHPLDCPICDQGGECQLQDLAVGYGGSGSRYKEEKRVVPHKDVGPLISMEEMSRCIHCTRCVRFGQEIAGAMELGMSHRGEHSEIETFLGATVDSELSGNMIDICPVGALTSKPFRYSARTWEMSRRKSISPHDSTGANLVVQVKNHRVMRVLPHENEAVNECWIADRDRFSYEALNGPDRLLQPMLKQGGEWRAVDWQTALEYAANGLNAVKTQHGAASIGTLASPHSTLEELYLAAKLIRGLGSQNIDSRLRAGAVVPGNGAHWLGRSIESLTHLDRVLVIGSNLRKDHPLFAQRVRQAVRKGAQVHAISDTHQNWAMELVTQTVSPFGEWVRSLAQLAKALAELNGVEAPIEVDTSEHWRAIAKSLCSGNQRAVLLGNAVAHHDNLQSILTLANWIGDQSGATVGFLTEAANTVGAQLVGATATGQGLSARQMVESADIKAYVLLNTEPIHDVWGAGEAQQSISKAELVISLSPFKSNMDISDLLLPIAPFTETSGSFVNAEGRLQSFHAVVKPQGETRPGWKVLRALGSMLGVGGMVQETSQEVLSQALPGVEPGNCVAPELLSNQCHTQIDMEASVRVPTTATIYQLDPLVRRSPSLQQTTDGRRSATQEANT